MTSRRDLAVVIANAAAIAHPADSSSAAGKKAKLWEKFIDSLDWNLLETKSQAKVDPVKAIMGALGAAPMPQ